VRILVLQGHPDPSGDRFLRKLGAAYARGASAAGHEVRIVDIAALEFPLLRSQREWEKPAPAAIAEAQLALAWCEHVVLLFPLWLGEMPALVKGFLEQLLRPGFATTPVEQGMAWRRLLKGRSARLVVTMGMPAFAYRWFFFAHGLRSLKRNILGFCGLGPIRETLIGNVEGCGDARRARWLAELELLGAAGA
jgi:putative NADPH-quinone reductase